VKVVDYCGQTVPRPRHLLTMRRAMSAVLVAFTMLTIAAAFFHDTLLIFDEPVSDAARGWGDPAFWRTVSFLGATEFYVPVAVVAMILLWNRCRSLAITWPLLIAFGALVNIATKVVVDRPRPSSPDTGVALASYPSGHTIQATVVLGLVAPTLYLLTRRSLSAWIAYLLLLGAAAMAGLSRVALGAHWLTDVIAGHLIGLALLIAADLVVEMYQRTSLPSIRGLHPAEWPSTT